MQRCWDAMHPSPGIHLLQQTLRQGVFTTQSKADHAQVPGCWDLKAWVGQDQGLEFLCQSHTLESHSLCWVHPFVFISGSCLYFLPRVCVSVALRSRSFWWQTIVLALGTFWIEGFANARTDVHHWQTFLFWQCKELSVHAQNTYHVVYCKT